MRGEEKQALAFPFGLSDTATGTALAARARLAESPGVPASELEGCGAEVGREEVDARVGWGCVGKEVDAEAGESEATVASADRDEE